MFPHSQNNRKRKSYEIPSLDEINERQKPQDIGKRAKPDFFRNQVKEKDALGNEQRERERQGIVDFRERTPLGDRTNKEKDDVLHSEIKDQGGRKNVEKKSSDQTKQEKGKIEKLGEESTQSLERQRLLRNKAKDRLADEVSRNLQENLKRIDRSIQLQEVNKFSMTERSMESRGVDPEKFRRVSQELSKALNNKNQDHLQISTTRKEFVEMAKKLGLIRPEI